MIEDVKKLKKEILERDFKIKDLEHLVFKDALTGLYNRRGFSELVKKIFSSLAISKSKTLYKREHFYIDSLTVLFFDIDNFKKLNDTYGHEIGDKILKFTASIIDNKIRISDIAARWGGEEMVVALAGADEKDGAKKAEEIRKAIRSRVKIPKNPSGKITVSVGVAEFDGKITLDELVKRADKAMYKAKTSGKDKVVAWSQVSK